MKKIKKYLAFISLAAIILGGIIAPLSVKAFKGGHSTNKVVVAANELVPYNFVAAGGLIDFRGEALKDVIVAGGTINISGPVRGDVIVVGGKVKIDSNVDGNVRVLGGTVDINGRVGKNVTVAGGRIDLSSSSEVAWDVMVGGGSVILNGKVGGNINAGAGDLTLGGEVGGSVDAYIGTERQLSVLKETKINGGLKYWSTTKITLPEEATIAGKVEYHSTIKQLTSKDKNRIAVFYFFGIIISILSALIIALIVIRLFREQTIKVQDKMLRHPWTSLGWGLVYLIIIPIIGLLLIPFIVTIPLVVIIVMLYGLTLYLAKIFVAIILGQQIIKYYNNSLAKNKDSNYDIANGADDTFSIKSIVVGVAVYLLIIHIPIIGLLVSFLGTIWAIGAIGRVVSEWIESKIGKSK